MRPDVRFVGGEALLVTLQSQWFWLDAATGELRLSAPAQEVVVSGRTAYLLNGDRITALGWREP